MRIAYFDCFSGISGDMILGAMIDAGLEVNAFQKELSKLKLPGCAIAVHRVRRGGLSAAKVDVLNRKNLPPLSTFPEIERQIRKSALPQTVQAQALAVFSRLAKAEAAVHGRKKHQTHLHEVGEIDTLVDVTGAVIGLSLLKIDRIVASPIHVGSGEVQTRSGLFPIPTPAAAALLKGAPVYATGLRGELTTPTGAAIITTLASAFSPLPPMTVERIGYGAGSAERTTPNLLRLFIGLQEAPLTEDEIVQIETNIDDMNPQMYEHVMETLFQAGALDVFLTPIIMKRSRPAILVTILSPLSAQHEILQTLFTETTTLGARIMKVGRKKLEREIRKEKTAHGSIRVKTASQNGRIVRKRPEFEDVRRLAKKSGQPVRMLWDEIMQGVSAPASRTSNKIRGKKERHRSESKPPY